MWCLNALTFFFQHFKRIYACKERWKEEERKLCAKASKEDILIVANLHFGYIYVYILHSSQLTFKGQGQRVGT